MAFAERPVVFDAGGIRATPRPFANDFATDWFHGYLNTVEDNAKSADNVTIDLEMNGKLKVILEGLDLSREGGR